MDEPDLTVVHSVLALPEILSLICELLTISDQASLLTVSRHFFTCAVPLVWNTISARAALPGILPDIDWTRVLRVERAAFDDVWSYDTDELCWAIGIDQPQNHIQSLDHQSLHRFNLYAPHIRRFQHGRGHTEGVAFWRTLLREVPTRPILPNLQALALSTRLSSYRTNHLISHINAFLCPTLTEFRCPGPGSQIISPLLASQLSARLAQQCPNIHTLDIYTRGTIFHSNSNLRDAHMSGVGPLSSVELSKSLAQFHNLRSLGGGPKLLAPEALVTLGSLPLLESFTIVYSYGDMGPETLVQRNISLPLDAFPALRHLGISCDVEIELVAKLWKLPSLVQRLTSIYVDLDSASFSDKQIRDLICSICKNSPLVNDLHIDLDSPDAQKDIDLFSPTVIGHFQRLPLRRLRVLTSYLSLEPAGSFEQLVLALSNIEYLDILCYMLAFNDLVLVVKHMPKLRFLRIGLPLSDWPSENQLPPSTNSNPTLYLAFHYDHGIFDNTDLDSIKSISLALHSLWPNGVHCAHWDTTKKYADEILPNVYGVFNLINVEIRKLCASETFSAPAYEDLALGWKYINTRHMPWLSY